jgi:hypothetical protein
MRRIIVNLFVSKVNLNTFNIIKLSKNKTTRLLFDHCIQLEELQHYIFLANCKALVLSVMGAELISF